MSDAVATRQGAPALQGARSALRAGWTFFRRWPVLPALVLVLIAFGTVAAPWVAPYSPEGGDLSEVKLPPLFFGGSSAHILGTDAIGRDIYSRVLYGGRISLMVAVVVLIAGGVVGTFLGLVSGYMGGWVDELVMRVVDANRSIPLILIALVVVSIFGAGLTQLLVLLAIWNWGNYARQVRGEVLALKEVQYVALAKVAGASTGRILLRHIFPGVVPTVTVIASSVVGSIILTEASLSYLGAGIPPPTPVWGGMVAAGQVYLSTDWWISIVPGMAIALVVMSFTFLGDWVRDYMDPRLRQLT